MTIKKTICLLILCLFFSGFKLFCQSNLALLNFLKNSQSFDSAYITLLNENSGADRPIIRTIDGKHRQLIAQTISSKGYYNILIQEDSIGVYLTVINEIQENKDKKVIKNVVLKIDSARFNNFLSIHNKTYQSALSANLYKNFSVNRYGRACGWGGMPTEKFSEMMYVCLRGSIGAITLRNWLKDYDYETKIMGATGLLILQARGAKLTDDDIETIEHLRQLNLPINYCSGCTEWNPVSSSRLLEKKIIAYY